MNFPHKPDFAPLAAPDAIIRAGNVRFSVLTDRLIRLEYSHDERFEDRASQAFWYREQPVPVFKKTITAQHIEIETDYLHLKYIPSSRGFTAQTF